MLEEGPTFLHNWTNYEHSPDGVVKIVSQRQHLYMAEGERTFYFNLLTPQGEAGLRIQRVGESVVKINQKAVGSRQKAVGKARPFEALIGAGDGGRRVGGLEVEAGLFRVERDSASFIGMRRVKAGRFEMTSSAPVSVDLNLKTGEGTVIAEGAAEVRLSAGQVRLDGRAVGRKGKDGSISFSVPAGTHTLKATGLKGDAFRAALGRKYASYADARLAKRPALVRKDVKAVWTFKGEGEIRSIFAGDVDGDGRAEVVAGSGAGDVHLLGPDGEERWRRRTGGAVTSVHAFKGSGRRMSVAAGSEDCGVYLFDAGGRERWVFRRGKHHGRDSRVVAVSAADLDGDGRMAVLAGTESWQLYAIHLDGSLRWQADMCHHSVTNLLPDDFDGDGRMEIAVGTEYYNCDFVNPDGTVRWLYRITTPEFTAVASADVNGDGVKEALFGTMDGTLHALPPTVSEYRAISTPPYRMGYATPVWKVNLGDEPTGIAVADVDGDGAQEIVVTSTGGNLYILDLEGKKRARRDLMRPLTALAALDGGGIVVGTADGGALVCNGRGEAVRSYVLWGGVTGLRAADVDGDGAEEVVAATTRGQVAVLK
jgi:outer membrane protein assembly factor BamB